MKSLKDLMAEHEAKGTRFERTLEEQQKRAVAEVDEKRATSVEDVKRAGVSAAEGLRKAGSEVQRGIENKAREARYISNEAHEFAREFQKQVEGKTRELEAATQLALSLKKRIERQARWVLGLALIAALLLVGWAIFKREAVLREAELAALSLQVAMQDQRAIRADIERLADLREQVPVSFWPQNTGEVWVVAPPGRTLVEVQGDGHTERVFRVSDQ